MFSEAVPSTFPVIVQVGFTKTNDGTKQLRNQNFPNGLKFREVTVFTCARGVRFSVVYFKPGKLEYFNYAKWPNSNFRRVA